MGANARRILPPLALVLALLAVGWATWQENPEPADFTFSNGTEIKSVDPARVTGQPEGAVIRALSEGLVNWDAKDLHLLPGVAERWDISEDGLIYTLHLRHNALWSNGDKVTAKDFVYSFRRFLNPLVGSQYTQLFEQVKNAVKYNQAEIEAGDPVEVELTTRPEGALPYARGRLLHGKLVSRAANKIPGEKYPIHLYEVEIDGRLRKFSAKPGLLSVEAETCKQVLFDVRKVGVRLVDEFTLQIELENPTPYFLHLLGFYPLFPVNQTCVETHGYPAWTLPKNLVSNGPFLLHSRKIRDRIRLKKNPLYWNRDNIHLETVDILAVESQTTELNLYLRGKIDYFRQVPPPIIPDLLRMKRDDFNPTPYLSIYYYKVNVDHKTLKDQRVRRALSLAIDRKQITEKVTRAGQTPAYRFVPPGIADFEEAKRRMGIKEDPGVYAERVKLAKKLLADAGYPNGEGMAKINITYNTNDNHRQVAELIQSQWKENLGVNAGLENKEWGTYQSDLRKQNYDIARRGWIGDYLDPNTFLDIYIAGGPNNNTGWGNEEYDRLVKSTALVHLDEKERAEVQRQVEATGPWKRADAEGKKRLLDDRLSHERNIKRMMIFVRAEQILIDEGPVIPLYYYVTPSMTRQWVEGFHSNLQDVHPFQGIRINKKLKAQMLREGNL